MKMTELIRQASENAHQGFEGSIADVDNELALWQPGGTAHPMGSRYAHMVVVEDIVIQEVLQGATALCDSGFAGKAGLDDPHRAIITTEEWAHHVQVDMGALRENAQATYAQTNEYLQSIEDDDLEREIDLSNAGLGVMSLGMVLLTLVFAHGRDVIGEISATKGVKG